MDVNHGNQKPLVFISHVHEDRLFAKTIRDWIDEELLGGVNFFVSSDNRSLPPGADWPSEIKKALAATSIALLIISPASIDRRWIYFEAGAAYVRNTPVVPICLNGSSIEDLLPPLSFLQALELPAQECTRQLIQLIAESAGLRAPKTVRRLKLPQITYETIVPPQQMLEARKLDRDGRRAYEDKNYQEAENLLKQSIELDPERVSAWGLLGRALVKLGKFEDAISTLTRALELTLVNRYLYLHNRGVAYVMLKKYGPALKDFDEVLRNRPKRTSTLRWRALAWLYLGTPENALKDVNAALEIRPRYICGLATKVVTLNLLGQVEEARVELSKCLALGSHDADDLYCLATAYSQLKEIDQAVQTLKIALVRDPKFRSRILVEPLFDPLKGNHDFEALGRE